MDGSLSPLQLRAPYGLQRLQWLRDSALHSAMHGAHYQALQGTLGYARVLQVVNDGARKAAAVPENDRGGQGTREYR